MSKTSNNSSSKNDGATPADLLLEAHVAFELKQWKGKARDKQLAELVKLVWSWANDTQLDAVVSKNAVRAAAERLALDMTLPDRLGAVIGAIADDLVRLDINKKTRVQDVVDEALFEDGVTLFIALEEMRNRMIKRALDSPIYTALASDILYQGIKDYIFSDSGAISSIPGVSKLIKGSSNAVSKRLPGLEGQVEKRVKAYIENNTAKTLARSEELLLESLDEDRIRALAEEIWAAIHDKPLSIAELVDADELQQLVDFGLRIWQELRETEYVGKLVDAAVVSYFDRHGDESLAALMGQVGIDEDLLLQEAQTIAPEVIDGLQDTGLLEQIIRQRLEPFYASDAFGKAVKQATGDA